MQSRTHNCGQLRLADAGRSVKIVGWMENIREVSSALAFIVVRDFYGTTQVVAETEDMVKAFKAVTRESTISVEGTVRERASKNPKLPTGLDCIGLHDSGVGEGHLFHLFQSLDIGFDNLAPSSRTST